MRLTETKALELCGKELSAIAEHFDVQDDGKFRVALWRALQELRRSYGMEFRIERGALVQITDGAKRRARAQRFASTGSRKRRRALAMLQAIPLDELDEDERQRVERAEEKLQRSCAMERLVARMTPEESQHAAAYVATMPRGKPKG